ncbi:MAG TPA: hypothetical protein VKB71_12645 [Rhizomicrobium sp.]|nr:hypothetical protein [Rhizomicrobium sp.]
MGRLAKILFLGAAMAMTAQAANAGTYGDDLSKCIVKAASDDDKIAFMQWMFYAISLHPSVQPYAKIDDKEGAEFNRKAGALVQRLLTVDCRTEAVAALKYEGTSAFESSFKVFGEIAMRGLMSDPKVAKGLAALGDSVDDSKFAELSKEAGVPDSAAPK